MILNRKQKEFLEKINLPIDSKDRIKDMNSFFKLFGNIKNIINNFPYAIGFGLINKPDNINLKIFTVENEYGSASLTNENESITFENYEKTFYDTLFFVDLINLLEKNNLVSIVDKEPDEIINFKVPVLEETMTILDKPMQIPFYKLWILIKEFVMVEFVPLPELKDFIENDYKTINEIDNEKEEKHRTKSLRWTISIAVVSILLSICTGIFNYLTYKTDRIVTIQNQKDTVKVILLDTLKENK